MYLLKKTNGSGYASRPGLHESYTKDIDKVRFFSTREEAERNRCVDNETIVPVGDLKN